MIVDALTLQDRCQPRIGGEGFHDRPFQGSERVHPPPSRPVSVAVAGADNASLDNAVLDNYQSTCPRCRRASVTLAQSQRVGGFG